MATNKTKLLASAQKYMRKGQYKKAIAEYEKVLKEDPNDVRARLNLANLYYRQKDLKRAVETFLAVARIYEDGGFTLKAIAVYKQVLKIVPDRDDLYVALASNYQQHGLLNEAAAQYREALRLLDGSGDQLGKLNVIRQILELDPNNVPDRLRLAEAYSALGQITDAVREFRQVAESLERLGYNEDFQRTAERLLYHQPDDAQTAKKLAGSYVGAGEPQRALPKLKIAFRSAPRDLEVLGILADAFNQLGQTHKAVTVLKEMARLYDKSGLERERDDCYSEILVLNPDDASARKAVAPRVISEADAGATIEFDDLSEPSALLPEAERPRAGARAAADTGIMSPAEAETAERVAQEVGVSAPPPPPAEVSASDDTIEASAEALIDQMLRDAIAFEESHQDHAGGPASAPAGKEGGALADDTDLEALFEAALREMEGDGAAAPPPPPLAAANPGVIEEIEDHADIEEIEEIEAFDLDFEDDLDFDDDDDFDDDEVGFGGGAEQTIVDNAFIPADVLQQVQTGMDLVMPARREEEETFGEGEDLLREELQELDFYIANGLVDEARILLAELHDRYPDHDYVVRRQERLERQS